MPNQSNALTAAVALAALSALGCSTPGPHTLEQFLAPDLLEVAVPYGTERVHVRYLHAPADSPDASAIREAIAEWAARGIVVEPVPAFPLLLSRDGARSLRLRRPDEPRRVRPGDPPPTLGLALLARGLGTPEPPFERRHGLVHIWLPLFEAFAQTEPELPRHALPQARAEAALAAARRIVSAAGAPLPEGLRVEALDDEALARKASILHRRELTAYRPTAYSPPGGVIYVKQAVGYGRSAPLDQVLTVLMIHEALHQVQWELGGVPEPVEDDAAQTWTEGHAEYWTRRLALGAGLEDAWLSMGWSTSRYSEGFSLWTALYERLEAAGHTVTLRPGVSPLVDALHERLLGPDRPRDLPTLQDPEPWLATQLDGWPARPWSATLIRSSAGKGFEHLEWRVTPAPGTSLFVYRCTPLVDWEALDPEAEPRRGTLEAWRSSEVWLTAGASGVLGFDAPAQRTGSWRVRLRLPNLTVSLRNGQRLYFGALTSPWVRVDPPG